MFGLVPKNPTITTEKENGVVTKVCIDGDTERVLQRQRLFAMGGSLVLGYAAFKLQGSVRLKMTVGAMAIACFYAHSTAYTAIAKQLKK